MPITPSDEDLAAALTDLRGGNPTLGASKLHAKLLDVHPDWSVSEKRVKKSLAVNNLVILPPPPKSSSGDVAGSLKKEDGLPTPSYTTVQSFNVSQYAQKIKVVDFGHPRGKGLVATAPIAQGEELWSEVPFVHAPDWEVYDLQAASRACMYCMTQLSGNALQASIPCQYSKNVFTTGCSARFCNRLCLLRAQKLHPLLCQSANPGCTLLLAFARQRHWTAYYAVVQCIARILLAEDQGRHQEAEDGFNFLVALSRITMEDRWKINGSNITTQDQQIWKLSHTLAVQALLEPENPRDKKQLSKLLSKPISDKYRERLFKYDDFMQMTAGMSLNLHYRGGLYLLHSHLNHSCQPTLSISILPPPSSVTTSNQASRSQPLRLTAVARRDIKPGEELTISYVNPDYPLEVRRRELRFWVIENCRCPRCVKEEKAEKSKAGASAVADKTKEGNGKEAHVNGNEIGNEDESKEGHEGNGIHKAEDSTLTEGEGHCELPGLTEELKAGFGLL